MKKLIAMALLVSMTAFADIEYDGNDGAPTAEELQRSRACFDELARNSCGEPGEDIRRFRACLSEVFPRLPDDCQRLMSTLYRRRD